MEVDERGQAKRLFPKCIVVKPRKGVVLNSVGLSGPGARAIFEMGELQKLDKPFFLSFMSVASTKANRLAESIQFATLLGSVASEFSAPFGLQVNLSCPNTGHDPSEIAKEAWETLGVYHDLRNGFNVPIVPKFNVLYPVEAVADLQRRCDGICISNTIPWGQLPADVDWHRLFDVKVCGGVETRHSPLADLGGGGLSGRPLLPLVEEWVKAARGRGVKLPINAGGGILHPRDVDVLAKAGADSVFLGSIAILRGWRLQATIRRAHKLLGA
jgi:dihydroorotate dehydrogenase